MVSESPSQSKFIPELTRSRDDGLCFFEYDIAQSELFDVNNLNGLKAAAQAMLNSCVRNQNRGGVVTGIGALLFRFCSSDHNC